jgi:hypothetical protein
VAVLAVSATSVLAQSEQDREALARIIRGEPAMKVGGPAPGDRKQPSEALSGAGRLEKLTGVWIDGPGFDVTYGMTYERCEARCLANAKCKMIEFYRPEQKCNLYGAHRPRLKGGSSIVGIRG